MACRIRKVRSRRILPGAFEKKKKKHEENSVAQYQTSLAFIFPLTSGHVDFGDYLARYSWGSAPSVSVIRHFGLFRLFFGNCLERNPVLRRCCSSCIFALSKLCERLANSSYYWVPRVYDYSASFESSVFRLLDIFESRVKYIPLTDIQFDYGFFEYSRTRTGDQRSFFPEMTLKSVCLHSGLKNRPSLVFKTRKPAVTL